MLELNLQLQIVARLCNCLLEGNPVVRISLDQQNATAGSLSLYVRHPILIFFLKAAFAIYEAPVEILARAAWPSFSPEEEVKDESKGKTYTRSLSAVRAKGRERSAEIVLGSIGKKTIACGEPAGREPIANVISAEPNRAAPANTPVRSAEKRLCYQWVFASMGLEQEVTKAKSTNRFDLEQIRSSKASSN